MKQGKASWMVSGTMSSGLTGPFANLEGRVNGEKDIQIF